VLKAAATRTSACGKGQTKPPRVGPRACRLVGQHRSTNRYEPSPTDFEAKLVARMIVLADQHPRWGYRMVHGLLVEEGWSVHQKPVEGFWRLGGVQGPPQRFTVGGRDIARIDFANTPIGSFPDGIRMIDGIMDVVSFNGRPMLRASSRSAFLIQLPDVLPENFTLEFEIVPKQVAVPKTSRSKAHPRSVKAAFRRM